MFARMVGQSLVKSARVTAWSLATLTACAALATLFFTMSLDVGEKMSRSLRSLGANAVAYRVQPDGRRPGSDAVLSPPAWAGVREVAESRGADIVQLSLEVGTVEGLPLAVVNDAARGLGRMTPYWAVQGRRVVEPGECVIGRKVAETLHLGTGGKVEVRLATGKEVFRVAGVFESGDEDEHRMFVSKAGVPDARSFAYALLSVPGGEAGIARLNEALAGGNLGIELKPLRQVLVGERTVLKKIDLLAGLALVAVLVLSGLGVTAAVLSRVVERRRELALLQALGAKRRTVGAFLLAEGAAVGIAAAVLGYGIGNLLAQLVVHHVFRVSVTPHATAFVAALAVTVVTALLAASVAARRALRMEPAVLLKGE